MKFRLFICIVCLCQVLAAQQTKLPAELARIRDGRVRAEGPLSLLVKGPGAQIKSATEALGGHYRYTIGDITSLSIPSSALRSLEAFSFVERIEQGSIRLKPLNDTMVYLNNVVQVHNGLAPLPHGYDGKGIVCGFIDTGIDFTHGDFKDSLGKSRINFIWDQSQPNSSNTPQPYNYGQEWTNTQIDAGLCTHRDTLYWGHGTRVAGTGAGNGRAVNRYGGVAPKADIIMVAIDFNNNGPTIADAADYIFSKATAMGEPCVINCSLGDYYGAHDGYDLQAQAIDALLLQANGRSFVAAAGNAGNIPYHLAYTVNSDTSFTWLQFNPSNGPANIKLYADTSNFQHVNFAVGIDAAAPGYSSRARTSFSSIFPYLGILHVDTLYNGPNRVGIVQTYGQLTGGVYSLDITVTSDSTGYFFRIMTTGSGKFDAWSFDMVSSGLPTASVCPSIVYYKLPDTDETLVNSFQCSPHVITVANYVNKNCFTDEGDTVICDTSWVFKPRRLAPSSSHGPTRTGVQKPDIAATGDYVMSCMVLSMAQYFSSTQIAKGGQHIAGGGTSQASPVIAGIAALYLQQNPHANHMAIKNAITCSARQDIYTGSALPDYKWGYGKADAFHALIGCTTGIAEHVETAGDLKIWPNPFNESVTISWDGIPGDTELRIFDLPGQEIRRVTLKDGMKSLTLDRGSMRSGIYFFGIYKGDKLIRMQKAAVE